MNAGFSRGWRQSPSAIASIASVACSPSSVSVAIWLAYAGRSTTRQSSGSGCHAGGAREAAREAFGEDRVPECDDALLVRREFLAKGRADGLPHAAARPACRGGTRPRPGSSGARRPTASRSTTAAHRRARARHRRGARPACGTCAGTMPSGPGRRCAAASRRARRRAGPTPRRPAPRRRPRRDAGRARAGTAPSWRAAGDAPACRPARGSTSHSSSWTSSRRPGVTWRPARESITTSRASPNSRAKLQRLWPTCRPSVSIRDASSSAASSAARTSS